MVKNQDVAPGPKPDTVRLANGKVVPVPAGWQCLPPGDAGLTRKVKALGESWTVKEKKGRRTFSRGVWAAAEQIAEARRQIEATRQDPKYQKRRVADRARRDHQQAEYVQEFRHAVLAFLNFLPTHADLADQIADRVAKHATPVGSGTVARTKRIPIEERAGSAVIAWMRHCTTDYDQMSIRRVKGQRREVRRQLAGQSRKLLDRYRRDADVDRSRCPLARALAGTDSSVG